MKYTKDTLSYNDFEGTLVTLMDDHNITYSHYRKEQSLEFRSISFMMAERDLPSHNTLVTLYEVLTAKFPENLVQMRRFPKSQLSPANLRFAIKFEEVDGGVDVVDADESDNYVESDDINTLTVNLTKDRKKVESMLDVIHSANELFGSDIARDMQEHVQALKSKWRSVGIVL